MQRKKFTKIYSQIYIPIFLFLLPIIASLFFAHYIVYFTQLSFVFSIISIFFIVSPLGSLRIVNENNYKLPFMIWLAVIFFIEIAIFLLFVGQAKTVIENMLALNYFSPVDIQAAWQILTAEVINNSMLFPWSLFAVIAAGFAFFSQKKDPLHPFSQTFSYSSNKKLVRLFARTADAYLELNGRMFVAIITGFTVIELVRMLTIKGSVFNLINVLIISMILVFLVRTKKLQNLFNKWDSGRFSQGIILLFMMIIMILIFWLVCIITIPIINHQANAQLSLANIALRLVKENSWQTIWQLWIWSWWILATALLISLLVKISAGRSLRSLVIAILLLPVLLAILTFNHFLDVSYYLNEMTKIPAILYSVQIITAGLFVMVFLQADSHAAVWLGFFPGKMPLKKRVFSSMVIWNYAIGIISLFLLIGVISLQLINMLLAIASFLIFLLMIKINYFKKIKD